jgi:hypothetical protein
MTVQIVHHKPAARGVSQLMYVGDADLPTLPIQIKVAIAIAIGWFLLRRR